jgi:fluoroacetyl-CoA thioesterase
MGIETLAPGLNGELEMEVTEEVTARHIGSGALRVFATPAMVLLVERACTGLVQPHLAQGQSSVGVSIRLRHLAPTPLGQRVRARVEVVAVEERLLTFKAEVWDDRERVGEGEHQRAVIDVERFLRRVQAKSE